MDIDDYIQLQPRLMGTILPLPWDDPAHDDLYSDGTLEGPRIFYYKELNGAYDLVMSITFETLHVDEEDFDEDGLNEDGETMGEAAWHFRCSGALERADTLVWGRHQDVGDTGAEWAASANQRPTGAQKGKHTPKGRPIPVDDEFNRQVDAMIADSKVELTQTLQDGFDGYR